MVSRRKRTRKQHRRHRGGDIEPHGCGVFEIIHDDNAFYFIKKKNRRAINCITVTDKQDRTLYLDSFFYDLMDDESKICKSSCDSQKIGKKAMDLVLKKFKEHHGKYDRIYLYDDAKGKGPWKIGDVEIGMEDFCLSVDSALKRGLCYYEQMFFGADQGGYDNRIQQLCEISAYRIYENVGTQKQNIIDIAKTTSLCGIYLLIKHSKNVIENDKKIL